MVSLSSTEMLKNMFKNYGFGAYLFSQLTLEQLEKLQEIKPSLKTYLEDLFSGKINDPEALSVLEEKYRNNLWIHQPKVYEFNIDESKFNDLIKNDDIDVLQAGVAQIVSSHIPIISDTIRKGDVIYAKVGNKLESYFIFSDVIQLQNVYMRYQNLELVQPIQYMDILGSTPVNYWNEINIPKLSFEFELDLVLDKISWRKLEEENQNYLVGQFIHQKKKVYLLVPIQQFRTAADKLAVNLQITNRNIFLTKDPKNIIESHPLIFYADLNLDLQNIKNGEAEDEDEY